MFCAQFEAIQSTNDWSAWFRTRWIANVCPPVARRVRGRRMPNRRLSALLHPFYNILNFQTDTTLGNVCPLKLSLRSGWSPAHSLLHILSSWGWKIKKYFLGDFVRFIHCSPVEAAGHDCQPKFGVTGVKLGLTLAKKLKFSQLRTLFINYSGVLWYIWPSFWYVIQRAIWNLCENFEPATSK